MPDPNPDQNATAPPEPAEANGQAPANDAPSWGQLWQVPAIGASTLLIALGVHQALDQPPEATVSDHLATVEQLLSTSEFAAAETLLEETVRPALPEATDVERALFHAIAADWIALSQKAEGVNLDENNRHIDERYRRAVEGGLTLSPERIERWAHAMIDLGQLDAAANRLAELEAMAAGQHRGDMRVKRRNRVYRRLVTATMAQPDQSFESKMQLLQQFRSDDLLNLGDERWVIAQQARLRLAHDRFQEAVDHLLVDMRRLEVRMEDEATFGDLLVLLAEGYRNLGDDERAELHLNQALEQLGPTDPARGSALVQLGEIALVRDEHDQAFEFFDDVVVDFANTEAQREAQLGRARVLSMLGDHERSREDFEALRRHVMDPDHAGRPTRETVTEALTDRHDAVLALGEVDEALAYIELADSLYREPETPTEVLFRSAMSHRQRADDLLAEATPEPGPDGEMRIPPAVRAEANDHYRQAGEDYARHARATVGLAEGDQTWADSLWMAADSYDLGGATEEAIELFSEYVGGRSDADSRMPEAKFRLAQALQSMLEDERAAKLFREVIDDHPRTVWATQSYVPYARSAARSGLRSEAEQELRAVVQGQRFIEPDAADYREALKELGRMIYEAGNSARAIEYLNDAIQRYPDDSEISEIRFRLADSYRQLALDLEEELRLAGALSTTERESLRDQREEYLAEAMDAFGEVERGYRAMLEDKPPDARLNHLQQVYRRQALLYRGDCAYRLGDYEQAITYYDEAARRYSEHHSSLIALMQIANACHALGDAERARVAEQRARVRLQQLPDTAFDDPDVLMDRRAWEQWLANSPPGAPRAASAADAS